jgi:acetyltransferase-like isoleucine patch superfamily enzyme
MSKLFGPTHYTEHDLANEGFKQLGSNVRIARNCTIIGAENISIGDNVRIDGYCTIVAAGKGYLNLGSFIHIGGYCAVLAAEGVSIADMSTLSWGVKVFTRSDDYSGSYLTNPTVPLKYTRVLEGKVTLGKHVIVGAESIILPKVTLGEGAAIGALSMVSKDLAPWGIYSGVPTKRLKERKRDLLELEQTLMREHGRA